MKQQACMKLEAKENNLEEFMVVIYSAVLFSGFLFKCLALKLVIECQTLIFTSEIKLHITTLRHLMITDILWTMCSLYDISKTEQSHHLTDFFIRADSKGLVIR